MTREQKAGAEMRGTPSVEARVSLATRVYEASADYDALLREYHRVSSTAGPHEKPAEVLRAELDVEIAKDLSANILALRNLTERGAAEANALSRSIRQLNWAIVILTAVLVLVGVGGIGAAWWFWSHPNP